MKTVKDCFQAAHGGTLFMDEIGNMSLTMQVKLYRVLQEGKVRPIGSTEESDVDVRIIAATNKEFEKEIAEGRFREDLYYRLSVIPIHVPALCERRDDIPLLARIFSSVFERPWKSLSRHLARGHDAPGIYDWPGNVRELRTPWNARLRWRQGGRFPCGFFPIESLALPDILIGDTCRPKD